MSLVLIEGFDFFQADIVAATRGWTDNFASTVIGRFAGHAARTAAGGTPSSKALPGSYSTIFAGFAYNFSALPDAATNIFCLRAGSTNTFRVRLRTDGKLEIANSSGTVIATGTTILAAGAWNYIAVKAFINGASGSCELRLNGVAGEIASTTGNFGSTNLDGIQLGALPVATGTSDFDDIYVLDTTGAAPRNTWLGDSLVRAAEPTADGAHTDWAPSIGTDHFVVVDELSGTYPDGDTTYIADVTPGDLETFTCAAIDTGATVIAVQTNLYARKDASSARQIAAVIRQSGTDHVGATVTLGASFAYFSEIQNQDPTGSDWTASTVNADEFGVKLIA